MTDTINDEPSTCEACGKSFIKTREWQKYCVTECRENMTDIYNKLLADIRPHIKDAASLIAELHRRKK